MSKRDKLRQEYLYGTSAPKIDENVHKVLIHEDEKELLNHKLKKEKVQRAKKSTSYKLKLIGNVLIVFVGCLFIMGQYASITFNQNEIQRLKTELKKVQNSNALLKSEIAESINLTSIKENAIQRLGMIEPASHQIVYIEIPKVSYTAYNQIEEDNKEHNQITDEEVVAAGFFDFFNWKE